MRNTTIDSFLSEVEAGVSPLNPTEAPAPVRNMLARVRAAALATQARKKELAVQRELCGTIPHYLYCMYAVAASVFLVFICIFGVGAVFCPSLTPSTHTAKVLITCYALLIVIGTLCFGFCWLVATISCGLLSMDNFALACISIPFWFCCDATAWIIHHIVKFGRWLRADTRYQAHVGEIECESFTDRTGIDYRIKFKKTVDRLLELTLICFLFAAVFETLYEVSRADQDLDTLVADVLHTANNGVDSSALYEAVAEAFQGLSSQTSFCSITDTLNTILVEVYNLRVSYSTQLLRDVISTNVVTAHTPPLMWLAAALISLFCAGFLILEFMYMHVNTRMLRELAKIETEMKNSVTTEFKDVVVDRTGHNPNPRHFEALWETADVVATCDALAATRIITDSSWTATCSLIPTLKPTVAPVATHEAFEEATEQSNSNGASRVVVEKQDPPFYTMYEAPEPEDNLTTAQYFDLDVDGSPYEDTKIGNWGREVDDAIERSERENDDQEIDNRDVQSENSDGDVVLNGEINDRGEQMFARNEWQRANDLRCTRPNNAIINVPVVAHGVDAREFAKALKFLVARFGPLLKIPQGSKWTLACKLLDGQVITALKVSITLRTPKDYINAAKLLNADLPAQVNKSAMTFSAAGVASAKAEKVSFIAAADKLRLSRGSMPSESNSDDVVISRESGWAAAFASHWYAHELSCTPEDRVIHAEVFERLRARKAHAEASRESWRDPEHVTTLEENDIHWDSAAANLAAHWYAHELNCTPEERALHAEILGKLRIKKADALRRVAALAAQNPPLRESVVVPNKTPTKGVAAGKEENNNSSDEERAQHALSLSKEKARFARALELAQLKKSHDDQLKLLVPAASGPPELPVDQDPSFGPNTRSLAGVKLANGIKSQLQIEVGTHKERQRKEQREHDLKKQRLERKFESLELATKLNEASQTPKPSKKSAKKKTKHGFSKESVVAGRPAMVHATAHKLVGTISMGDSIGKTFMCMVVCYKALPHTNKAYFWAPLHEGAREEFPRDEDDGAMALTDVRISGHPVKVSDQPVKHGTNVAFGATFDDQVLDPLLGTISSLHAGRADPVVGDKVLVLANGTTSSGFVRKIAMTSVFGTDVKVLYHDASVENPSTKQGPGTSGALVMIVGGLSGVPVPFGMHEGSGKVEGKVLNMVYSLPVGSPAFRRGAR